MCSGVRLLKEQEIGSKCQRRNTTQKNLTQHHNISRAFSINNAGEVRKIQVVSRIDGGVARQQQPDDFNTTLRSGDVQRGPFAERTGNEKQTSEAQHNRTS
jgi:hypothetical protein